MVRNEMVAIYTTKQGIAFQHDRRSLTFARRIRVARLPYKCRQKRELDIQDLMLRRVRRVSGDAGPAGGGARRRISAG